MTPIGIDYRRQLIGQMTGLKLMWPTKVLSDLVSISNMEC